MPWKSRSTVVTIIMNVVVAFGDDNLKISRFVGGSVATLDDSSRPRRTRGDHCCTMPFLLTRRTVVTIVMNKILAFEDNGLKISRRVGCSKAALDDTSRPRCKRGDHRCTLPFLTLSVVTIVVNEALAWFENDGLKISGRIGGSIAALDKCHILNRSLS